VIKDGQVMFFERDHLGSVRAVIDRSGNVVERNDYTPFGRKHENAAYPISANNRFKFNGKEEQFVGNLQLLDYGARTYDPAIARFTTPDPWGEKYRGWSLYNYTLNNPVLFVDPDGRDPKKAWQLFNESLSGKVTLGLQGGISLEIVGRKIGVEINRGSGTMIYKEPGEGIKFGEGNVVNAGGEIGFGLASYGIQQEVKDNGDGTALRTTESKGSFLIVAGSHTEKETVNIKTGQVLNKTESNELNSEVSVKVSGGIALEINIDLPKFTQALDELFKSKNDMK
jgi:RHS repeat-associated protein